VRVLLNLIDRSRDSDSETKTLFRKRIRFAYLEAKNNEYQGKVNDQSQISLFASHISEAEAEGGQLTSSLLASPLNTTFVVPPVINIIPFVFPGIITAFDDDDDNDDDDGMTV
jgi:hypothetical protein